MSPGGPTPTCAWTSISPTLRDLLTNEASRRSEQWALVEIPPRDSNLLRTGNTYALLKANFHVPGEHSVDGKRPSWRCTWFKAAHVSCPCDSAHVAPIWGPTPDPIRFPRHPHFCLVLLSPAAVPNMATQWVVVVVPFFEATEGDNFLDLFWDKIPPAGEQQTRIPRRST